MPEDPNDEKWIRLALREARKGIGRTSPNPPVGAVIVRKGKLLGKGFHRKAGEPHAEIEAIAKVGGSTKGATIYVTLEPCSTVGKTGACSAAIIEGEFARVVYAVNDPNTDHAGRVRGIFKRKGIEVTTGVCKDEATELLRPWRKFIETGMPWVIAKAGISLDGRMTRPPGESQWLTNPAARDDVQKLRSEVDAIIIGAETLRRDNPMLTLRGKHADGREQPWRVVLTRSGSVPMDAKLFTDVHHARTLVLRNKSLGAVLGMLAKRGVVSVLIEGGSQMHAEAFSKGVVDEVCLYQAPLICGDDTVPMIGGSLKNSLTIRKISFKKIGDNLRMRGLV